MKELNAWRLAFVYAGCFLGAGYISGQELWQFFGAFGVGGIWGLTLCAVLQGICCVILLSLVRRGDIRVIEQVAVRRERRGLRAAVGGAQLALLLGVAVIMSAGVGALTAQMLGRGTVLASFLFCLLIAVVALQGMRGLVSVFSYVVPVLIIVSFAVAVWAAVHFGLDRLRLPSVTHGVGSPLLSHWAVAAVSFVSYNLFGSIAILVPIARAVPNARVARRGAVIGALILFAAACAILFSLYLAPATVTSELPMLALAQLLHPAAEWLFAALLLVAMFGTALSCAVAAREYLVQKFAVCARHPAAVVFSVCALAFVGGLFGFGDLIGWIYPIFGYFGFVVLCSAVAHEGHLRRSEKKKEKP